MSPCKLCGRGTQSQTGYCMCSWKQNDEGHKIIRQRAKATAAQEKFDREMSEYVQHLIDTFEAP